MTFVSRFQVMAATVAFCCVLDAQTGGYDQALALVRSGSFDAAIPILEGLLGNTPGDLKARNLLGIALSGAGRLAQANEHFMNLLKASPAFLPAIKNLAHNQLELGRIADARQGFEHALKLAPADPAVHFGLGQIAFTSADHARAVEHYEKSAGLHLRDPLAQLRYATSCHRIGANAKALEALKALPLEVDPALQLEAGVLLAGLEQYREAVTRFEAARAGGAEPGKVGFNLALAHLKLGQLDAAIQEAEKTLRAAGPSPDLYSVLSQAYDKAGRTANAYEALRAATKINPRDESPYLELIALCLHHENQELGLEIANIGVRLVPASPRLRLQRGVIYALQSRFDQAASDFREAVQLNPDAPLGYVAEALVLLRTDQIDRAIAVLRRRVRDRSDDYLANWLLAEALTRQSQDEAAAEQEAVAALERSIAANGGMSQSRALLGKLMLARGNTSRAQQELEKALELDPGSTSATYQLAQVYRKQGKTREANELFAKVSRSKAEDPAQFTNRSLLRIVRDDLKAPVQE